MASMGKVMVAGVGMTNFGKFMERGVRSLAEEAVGEALKDSGVAPKEIQAAFFSNAIAGLITGQEMIRGQVALRNTGILGIPLFNVENACASASSAFHLAWMSVASGMYDVALAVGAEKMSHPDKSVSFRAIGTAVDLEQMRDLMARMSAKQAEAPAKSKGEAEPAGTEKKEKKSFFMDIYAASTMQYMKKSGATQQTFADIAVKSHAFGALNPKAQFHDRVTREQVLGAREVSWPLTLLMCSPIGDGSAAAVLMSEEYARKRGISKAVQVRASVVMSGTDHGSNEPTACERVSHRAYEISGIAPKDINVLEVHDAAAPAELITCEELGLCPPGKGPELLASGATNLGGKHVVNPSGGLLSKGHPIGATGIAQIVEIVDQLRGRCGARQVDGAKVGLTENGGGFLGTDAAAMAVHIFSV
ncbi:MAG TPA: thiolase family protein [Candidatus Binataceae bacterium]|nr:thiolase family protein [Candidatus Binataceae bacterium]